MNLKLISLLVATVTMLNLHGFAVVDNTQPLNTQTQVPAAPGTHNFGSRADQDDLYNRSVNDMLGKTKTHNSMLIKIIPLITLTLSIKQIRETSTLTLPAIC
ncbi:MAG: hypothetical protein HWD61_02935 [Parachlamydiaceae bacterium]|nr:MAG: hypothetical protein HWD61_02935 [Parachlamydiaceae bacterium]